MTAAIVPAESVPGVILTQLGGGRRIGVMTGAKHIVADSEKGEVRISLPRNKAMVCVRLDPSDTYTVELCRIADWKQWSPGIPLYKVVRSESGVYADGLQDAFTRLTGLQLRL